jgi:translation initiation factor 1A
MPKNKGKGGKNRRRGKNEGEEKRELIFKEDGQEYAQVIRMLGNGRLEAQCFDGTRRLCHIRGKLRKKVWVASGDIVLVGLRSFQDEKADVILRYNPDEARNLKAYKEIPDNAKINEGAVNEDEEAEEDCAFTYVCSRSRGPRGAWGLWLLPCADLDTLLLSFVSFRFVLRAGSTRSSRALGSTSVYPDQQRDGHRMPPGGGAGGCSSPLSLFSSSLHRSKTTRAGCKPAVQANQIAPQRPASRRSASSVGCIVILIRR